MRPGRYAADDGSFVRSASGAGARGLALLALALLIGVVLLNATDADPPGAVVSARGDSDTPSGNGASSDAAGEPAATTAVPVTTTTAPARAPKDVKVIVANASAVRGAAGNVKKVLDPAGFNVLSPANSAAVPETSVYFTPGYEPDALAVAKVLTLPGTTVKALPAPAPFDTKGANVAVLLGADQATKFAAAPAGAGAGATTTTAAHAATTTTAAGAATTTTAAGAKATTSTSAARATTSTSAPPATTSTTKKP